MSSSVDKVVEKLNKEFPHGHKDFIKLTVEEIDLHNKKNYDYSKGGDPLGNFRRVSTILGQYPGLDLSSPTVIAVVYMLKQLDAALWMMCQGYEGNIEGIDERMQDIHVYVKLARILHKEVSSE